INRSNINRLQARGVFRRLTHEQIQDWRMTDSPSTEKKDFMGPPRPEHEVTNDTSGKKPQEMTTSPEAPATPDLSPSANAVPTSKGSGRSGSSPPPQSPSDALRAQERHPKSAPGAGSSKLAVGISVIALLL